jgi:hypothetical protein
MVMLPPGSGKSTYVSVLFPPWWLANHPDKSILAASHSEELAERFGAARAERHEVIGERRDDAIPVIHGTPG